jgi:hypothetical protein
MWIKAFSYGAKVIFIQWVWPLLKRVAYLLQTLREVRWITNEFLRTLWSLQVLWVFILSPPFLGLGLGRSRLIWCGLLFNAACSYLIFFYLACLISWLLVLSYNSHLNCLTVLILKRLLGSCLICLRLFLGYSYGFSGRLHTLVPGSHLKYEFSLYVLNVGPYLLAHCDLLLNRINGRSLQLLLRGLSETGGLCL